MKPITIEEATEALRRIHVPSLSDLFDAFEARPGVRPGHIRHLWEQLQIKGHVKRRMYSPTIRLRDREPQVSTLPKPFYMEPPRSAQRYQEVR